jgi:DNA-binding transcriptional ArsR family regulator
MTEPATGYVAGRPAPLDATTLHALAHPLRVRILDELAMYGPLTASGLGERLGESSGSTSYHLRQLEKHGLVAEDAVRGTARERWWMRVPGSVTLPEPRELPPGSADRLAAELVDTQWARSRETALAEYQQAGDDAFEPEWFEAASIDTINVRLTAEQLAQFVADVDSVIWRYLDTYKTSPTPGSRPVQIQLSAFPLVRGELTEPDRTERS